MLRFIYIICDVLATICAIASPIAIIQWLLKACGLAAKLPLVNALDPLFMPLNSIVDFFLHALPFKPIMLSLIGLLPSNIQMFSGSVDLQTSLIPLAYGVLVWQGNSVPIAQGISAIVLTLMFFLLNFAAEMLRARERRMILDRQSGLEHRRLQRVMTEQKRHQKELIQDSRVYLQMQCDFLACPAAGQYAETLYPKYGARLHRSTPSGIGLEFTALEPCLKYSLEVCRTLLNYYASLRPMDPQPPFRLGIQVLPSALPHTEGLDRACNIADIAGPNQVLFSQEGKILLEAQGLSFRIQSVGVYMVGQVQSELYRILDESQIRKF